MVNSITKPDLAAFCRNFSCSAPDCDSGDTFKVLEDTICLSG